MHTERKPLELLVIGQGREKAADDVGALDESDGRYEAIWEWGKCCPLYTYYSGVLLTIHVIRGPQTPEQDEGVSGRVCNSWVLWLVYLLFQLTLVQYSLKHKPIKSKFHLYGKNKGREY
jgi:hypothetical protein